MAESDLSPAAHARALAAQRARVPHTCVVCGQAFVAVRQARYCSNRCAQRAAYARHAEQRRADRRAKYRAQRRPASSRGEG